MSSDSLRARSPFFAFDSETGGRRPRWVVFLAGLLSVVIGLAGILVTTSSASAHDRDFDVSCFGLTVKLTNYNTNNSTQLNTVSIIVDTTQRVDKDTMKNFGTDYTFELEWDPSVDHSYAIEVRGHDGYNLITSGTQKACAKPTVGLTATECHQTGGTSIVEATFSGFASYSTPKDPNAGYPSFAPTYTATLLRSDGATVDTILNVQSIPGGKITWPTQLSGFGYTVVIKADGTINAGLTASAVAAAVGCPELKDFLATANQCNSPTGDNSSITVKATVTPGRAYSVVLTQNGSTIQTQNVPVTNTSTTVDLTFSVAQNLSGLQVIMTDTAAAAGDQNRERKSNLLHTTPCPKVPTLSVTPSVCTTVGGTLSITVELGNLVPGRSYEVLVGATVVETIPGTDVTGLGLTRIYSIATAGSYVITVRDVAVPAAAKSTDPVSVASCPTQPVVTLDIVECSVPGGTGSITAHFSGLSVGRTYSLSITENGNAMGAYPDVTIDSSTVSKVYSKLVAGATYNVTVIDKGATGVMKAAAKTLKVCPDTPTISITPQCELLSNTTYYGVTLDKLQGGQQYLVTIKNDKGADAAPPVTVTGGAGGLAPTFQVPNKAFYTIAVTNVATPAITAAADVYAAVCDLPTFDLPPELPTLALTGAGDTTMPMLGALGLVQFGVALLALAAMLQFTPRRRFAA